MLFLAVSVNMTEQKRKTRRKPALVKKAPASSHLETKDFLKFLLPVLCFTFLLFLPTLRNDFTNWDDILYVTNNPLLKKLNFEGLKAIFSTPVVSNYHPVTILSLAINYQLAELTPWSYHLTSIGLHLINTSLVFWFIMLLSGHNRWVSTFSALLFGIHPMHVESVAWISERKDLLYTMFYLLAMIAYVRYIKKKQVSYLFAAFILGLLSLLSKPAAIVLPLSLILLDYYFQRKWSWKWIIEKLPLFIFSGIMTYVTLEIQSERAIASLELYDFVERIGFAGYGLIWYLVKFIFPFPLSALHPFPEQLLLIYYISTVAALGGCLLLIFKIKNRNYRFAFGFYMINLLLVLQLVSIGNAVVAERYTYVPYISLFFLLGIEVVRAINGRWAGVKNILIGLVSIWMIALAVITFTRIPAWRNSEILWNDVLKKYPESPRAWTNKALIYFDTMDWTKVIEDLSNALKYDPNYRNALEWRARAYLEIQEGEKALADAQAFYKQSPDHIEAIFILARSYEATGHTDEALDLYNKLIPLAPDVPEYTNNRGVIYFNKLQRYEEAKKDFERCLQLDPDNGLYYINLSRCYYMMGNIVLAKENAQKAKALGIAIDPAYAGVIGLQ